MDKKKILKAMADETRMKIRAVASSTIIVSGLAQELNLSEAAISQHLKVLWEAGLLRWRKAAISCTIP